jgi:hypothetical protein
MIPKKSKMTPDQIHEHARAHMREMLAISHQGDFAIDSTVRQLNRYITWWGHETFEKLLEDQNMKRLRSWRENGLNTLAQELVKGLEKPMGIETE